MPKAATMPRISPITADQASGDLKKMYEDLHKKMGKLPNIFQYMGNSPTVLKAFMMLNELTNQTSLSQELRSQIALAVAEANQCFYCLSAHSALATKAGMTLQQVIQSRRGESQNPKTQMILKFAKSVVNKRGKIDDHEIANLKSAGVSDKELAELILVIQLNMFTNYFNHIADTPIDFPQAQKL